MEKDNKYLTSFIMHAENHLFQNCFYIVIFNNFTMKNHLLIIDNSRFDGIKEIN